MRVTNPPNKPNKLNMKIQIKHRVTSSILFECDCDSIAGAVANAISAKADLSHADLSHADLRCADLSHADLSHADLRCADLRYADLRYADLSYADLRSANLRSANLSYANLSYADLRCADLRSADLRCADLRSANLRSDDLLRLLSSRTILPEGDLIGWKQLNGGKICKLLIPASAKRLGGVVGRKCRAEYATVLDGDGMSSRGVVYKTGETVRPDSFDPNPMIECSNGIHFFITRQEAEEYAV